MTWEVGRFGGCFVQQCVATRGRVLLVLWQVCFLLGNGFFQPLHVQEILNHMDSDGIVSNGSAMRLPRCFSHFFPLFDKNNVSALSIKIETQPNQT